MISNENSLFENDEIRISEVIWQIIFSWQIILVTVVIGMVLGGIISILENRQTDNKPTDAERVGENILLLDENGEFNRDNAYKFLNSNNIVESDADSIIQSVIEAKIYSDIYKEYKEYLDNSIIMKLDSNNIRTISMDYYINNINDEDDSFKENSIKVVNEYLRHLKSEELLNKLSEELSLEVPKSYLSETIEIRSDEDFLKIVNKFVTDEIDFSIEEGNSSDFNIKIYLNNSFDGEAALEIIDSYLNELYSEISESFGQYDLVKLDKISSNCVDNNIILKKANIINEMGLCTQKIDNIRNKFADTKVEMFTTLFNAITTGENPISTNEVVPQEYSHVIKYIIIGGVLCLCLALVFIIYRYVNKEKIESELEIRDRFNLPIIGVLAQEKRLNNIVDKTIMNVYNRKRNLLDEDEAIEMISTNIKVMSKENGYTKIMITGCDISKVEGYAEIIRKKVGQDIEIILGDNIALTPKTLEKLSEVDAVIFFEVSEFSSFKYMRRELEIVNGRKDIMGTIFLG